MGGGHGRSSAVARYLWLTRYGTRWLRNYDRPKYRYQLSNDLDDTDSPHATIKAIMVIMEDRHGMSRTDTRYATKPDDMEVGG